MNAVVHSAAVMDRDGAFFVLGAAYAVSDRLELIWADMGYRGERLKTWVEQVCGWKLEIVKRPSKWGALPHRCRATAYAALHGAASSVGGRANLRVGRALPADEQRL
jgi:transposase